MAPNDRNVRHQLVVKPRSPGLTKCQTWLREALATSLPAASRIEAIENLARECPEDQTLRSLCWLPDSNDEESVRRAVVRLLPNWGDGPMQLNVLVRALSIPGMRGEAVKALDRLAPVTGQREARLRDEVQRRGAGGRDFIRVAALPKLYGRDSRVLELLREWMRTGNQWQRALAASELCGLGETETAFRAASDLTGRVRKSLAGAIGYFNEQCGAEVLSHLLTDGDAAVSQAARASLEMLARPGMEPPRPGETYSSSEWAALLRELSEFRLTDPELAARLSDPVLRGNWRGNWLGEPGATAPEIIALERRIGQALPPSYRSFLAESDGFLSPDIFIPALHGTKEADWFGVRHAEWAQAYRDTYPHLGSYLQVSSAGDGAVVLLNPNVKASDGEWQTCFFANWIPGARVHASFGDFMRKELEQHCEWRNR